MNLLKTLKWRHITGVHHNKCLFTSFSIIKLNEKNHYATPETQKNGWSKTFRRYKITASETKITKT